jgi:hypothetical protein
MTKRRTPPTLGSVGGALWRELMAKYQFRPDEARVLFDACAEADLIDTLQAAQNDQPLTVRGSMGQQVINPLVSELRQHRATLASLLRHLKLPDENNVSGSVPGSLRSTQARAAAQKRWRGD